MKTYYVRLSKNNGEKFFNMKVEANTKTEVKKRLEQDNPWTKMRVNKCIEVSKNIDEDFAYDCEHHRTTYY